MKITRRQLRQIIQEEISRLDEEIPTSGPGYIWGIKFPGSMGINRFLQTDSAKNLLRQMSSSDIAKFHNKVVDYFQNCDDDCILYRPENLHPRITNVDEVQADSVIAMPFKAADSIRTTDGGRFEDTATGLGDYQYLLDWEYRNK
jgi:hypothetical protein